MSVKNDEERIKVIEDAFLAIYDIMEKQESNLTPEYSVAISNLQDALKISSITPAQERYFKRVLNQLTEANKDLQKKLPTGIQEQ